MVQSKSGLAGQTSQTTTASTGNSSPVAGSQAGLVVESAAVDWKLEVVPIPASDIERSKRFYEEVGFAVDHDTRVGDLRIVQLTPPGSACSIVLGADTALQPGSMQGVQLVVDDIRAARTRLLERGAEVGEVQHFEEGGWVEGPGGDWNSFAFFKDPDGNGWMLQERPSGA